MITLWERCDLPDYFQNSESLDLKITLWTSEKRAPGIAVSLVQEWLFRLSLASCFLQPVVIQSCLSFFGLLQLWKLLKDHTSRHPDMIQRAPAMVNENENEFRSIAGAVPWTSPLIGPLTNCGYLGVHCLPFCAAPT